MSVLFPFRLLLIFLLMTVTTSYTINNDCNLPAGDRRNIINTWVVEAQFFFRQAARVLSESRRNQNTVLLPCVREIVNACLGTGYTMPDIDHIQSMCFRFISSMWG